MQILKCHLCVAIKNHALFPYIIKKRYFPRRKYLFFMFFCSPKNFLPFRWEWGIVSFRKTKQIVIIFIPHHRHRIYDYKFYRSCDTFFNMFSLLYPSDFHRCKRKNRFLAVDIVKIGCLRLIRIVYYRILLRRGIIITLRGGVRRIAHV